MFLIVQNILLAMRYQHTVVSVPRVNFQESTFIGATKKKEVFRMQKVPR